MSKFAGTRDPEFWERMMPDTTLASALESEAFAEEYLNGLPAEAFENIPWLKTLKDLPKGHLHIKSARAALDICRRIGLTNETHGEALYWAIRACIENHEGLLENSKSILEKG